MRSEIEQLNSAKQGSGHTIHAAHIERPVRAFQVEWEAPGYINTLRFESGTRWARVLAETEAGALRIARYHYSNGLDFRMKQEGHRESIGMSL